MTGVKALPCRQHDTEPIALLSVQWLAGPWIFRPPCAHSTHFQTSQPHFLKGSLTACLFLGPQWPGSLPHCSDRTFLERHPMTCPPMLPKLGIYSRSLPLTHTTYPVPSLLMCFPVPVLVGVVPSIPVPENQESPLSTSLNTSRISPYLSDRKSVV